MFFFNSFHRFSTSVDNFNLFKRPKVFHKRKTDFIITDKNNFSTGFSEPTILTDFKKAKLS